MRRESGKFRKDLIYVIYLGIDLLDSFLLYSLIF